VETPITCALDADSARARIEEWQAVGVRAVGRARRVAPGRLELTLLPDADVGSILRLAREEVACCAFFRFTFTVDSESVTLVIGVPDEASSILDQFASVLS
jgi:MerR family transcriptional regulator, copper efflux regulator